MDPKLFGSFIAELRRERGLTQAEVADIIGVTDKAVSRWERGAGFPDIATLEPLAAALDATVYELLTSARTAPGNAADDSRTVEIMQKTAEIARENRSQERAGLWLAGIAALITALPVRMFGRASMGAAIFTGCIAALAIVSLFMYVRNHADRQSRRIYGTFMLLGTLISIVLLQLAGVDTEIILWCVYGMLAFTVLLTYR